MRPSAPPFIANFDSASAMLRATSNFLHGEDFPTLGQPPALKPFARAARMLPRKVREQVFALGGAGEGVTGARLASVDAEQVAEWAVQRYPQRRYPTVMIGSSNGAGVHLAAALGVPWLPQTFLIPVLHPAGMADLPKKAMAMGREHGPRLLAVNPDLQLHHMHDANQDRLMVEFIDYFRVKWRRLARAYMRFLDQCVAEDGTLLIVDCRRTWPVTRIGPRHVFQHGALGGATEDEFLHGSERVEAYLERYDAPVRKWDSPQPDETMPEAEWGFEQALGEDIERYAAERGLRVRRLVFEEPEHLSEPVADFHREGYRQRGMPANRLLIESFVMLDPYWALRTGSVPLWMKFNMEPSAEFVERYLDARADDPFDEIHLMLFQHGVDAVGSAGIERWKQILARARRRGRFVGVREDLFPRDFGAFARYHDEVQQIPARYPLPPPRSLADFERFLARSEGRYRVEMSGAAH